MIDFSNTELFWQYPVITEEAFFKQNKQFTNYIGVPWATAIDKGVDTKTLYELVKPQLTSEHNYTCCQHIYFRRLIPLLRSLNITRLYSSHKIVGEDIIEGVKIKPCPLYAVNIEDSNRNSKFKNIDIINCKRDVLYSFIGAHMQHYLSDIRLKIFEMKHPDSCVIQNTGMWHFEKQVYTDAQNINRQTVTNNNSVDQYNDLLIRSKFSLCPGGAGPNTIRFWESLGAGAIPVLLSDTYELPEHELWEEAIIQIKEPDVNNIENVLKEITDEQILHMRTKCISIYDHFKDNYINNKNK